jgi:hypothetical protein
LDNFQGNQRRVWRYQRGNQNPYIEEEQTAQWPNVRRYQRGNYNPYIEEEQTTQWPKEKGQTYAVKKLSIEKILENHMLVLSPFGLSLKDEDYDLPS